MFHEPVTELTGDAAAGSYATGVEPPAKQRKHLANFKFLLTTTGRAPACSATLALFGNPLLRGDGQPAAASLEAE